MKIIYTAIFGDYDDLHEPTHVIPGCRYICFTDRVLNSKVWELKMVKPQYDSVRQARECKILFATWFPFFEGKAMWIDANQRITSDISYLFDISTAPLTLLQHPERDCIYEESRECVRLKKDDETIIGKQILKYLKLGYPRHYGMVATGLMIRTNTTQVNKYCEEWFEQVRKGSRRDQLSFNYIGWSCPNIKLMYDLIPFDTLKKNFTRCNHKK